MSVCPKCGAKKIDSIECAVCGIVFSKYKNSLEGNKKNADVNKIRWFRVILISLIFIISFRPLVRFAYDIMPLSLYISSMSMCGFDTLIIVTLIYILVAILTIFIEYLISRNKKGVLNAVKEFCVAGALLVLCFVCFLGWIIFFSEGYTLKERQKISNDMSGYTADKVYKNIDVLSDSEESVFFKGVGNRDIKEIKVPSGYCRVNARHLGNGSFTIIAYVDENNKFLVNTDGVYTGDTFVKNVSFKNNVNFSVLADGEWEIKLSGVGKQANFEFEGNGDNVSGFIEIPEGEQDVEFFHTGRGCFSVYLQYPEEKELLVEDVGAVRINKKIKFKGYPCFWEVKADGEWGIRFN